MNRHFPVFFLTSLVALGPSITWADAPTDLNKCQTAVATAGRSYVNSVVQAVGACLKQMSTGVIAKGGTTAAAAQAAAKPCVTAFRKLRNTIKPALQLANRFDAKLGSKCDPALNLKLEHSESDIYTIGATTLSAGNLGAYCRYLGGNGTLASFSAWRDCLRSAAQCQARQAIALQWPRALEYFAALKPAISALPATAASADALAALTTFDAALEGATEDNVADTTCGLPSGLLATGQTTCDQNDGTFGPCPASQPGQDGEVMAGVPSRYTDNGDGTITDHVTGLMWEKFDRAGGDHDVDYITEVLAGFVTWHRVLNLSPNGRPLNRDPGFAGYEDWRMPNRRELESLVDLGRQNPAIDPVFNNNCTPGCTLSDCSCTASDYYWSSTNVGDFNAWAVSFADGSVITRSSAEAYRFRGVRGGHINPVLKPSNPIAFDVDIKHTWHSSCIPITVIGFDADSICELKFEVLSIPQNGFLTEYVTAPNPCFPAQYEHIANETNFKRFTKTQCYVTFSTTFVGTDSFTYQLTDREGNVSNVGLATITVFEAGP